MMSLVAAGGGERVPSLAALVVSLVSLVVTGFGLWLGSRATNRTIASQTKADQVKAEQHLIEILQEETTRLRADSTADMTRLRTEHNVDMIKVRDECAERIEAMRAQLHLEQEAHERTRHRYLEDMAALKLIVRDEITKAAASLMEEDVRDVLRPSQQETVDLDLPKQTRDRSKE